MANKIIHIHSNVVNNNKPKLPTKDQLEYGEIAINYAKGNETISLKNSSDEIIEFKSKNYVDEQINSNNERIQAVEDSIDLVNETIEDNELVTATAITNLEDRTTNVENGLTNKSDIEHTHVSSAITDSISASGSITNSASGLVQGKAVYNYAAPKSHASSATTYGVATTSNYGHVKISNGDVATVASGNGLAAGMDHSHSNYALTGHTHDAVSSSNNGFAPKVSDGGTIDNSSNDLVLTSDNGTVGWRKLPANAFKDTDTKVIQTVVSANAEYPVLLANSGQTSNTTGTTYFDSGITINPSANTINAKASSATTADKVSNNLTITLNSGSTEGTNKFTFNGSSGKTINITASNIGAATITDIDTEIAKVVANAPENFDTLKEIADWISNDTTGAAKMANDINELKNSKSPTGHTHVSSAITDSINSMSGVTGTETKLVQAKAVYELINDTEEQIAETLLEHDSRLTTLSNNIDSIVTDIEENELVTATAITELENHIKETDKRVNEFIIGTQTGETSDFTGVSIDSALYDGKQITYLLPYNSNGGRSNLTLEMSDGSTTSHYIYYTMNDSYNSLSTEYKQNTLIKMVFRESYSVGNRTYPEGWWCDYIHKQETIYNLNDTNVNSGTFTTLASRISIPAKSLVIFKLTYGVVKSLTSNCMVYTFITNGESSSIYSGACSIPAFTATEDFLPSTTIEFSHYFPKEEIISVSATSSLNCILTSTLDNSSGAALFNGASIITVIPVY